MTNETGFPDVPDGYFWRVAHPKKWSAFGFTEPYDNRDELEVRLVRKATVTEYTRERRWFGYRDVTNISESVDILYSEVAQGTNPIALRNAANRIMKRWKRDQEMKMLIGDYPPKKLP